jgi:hypothetical protein
MRVTRLAIAVVLVGWASAAQATTVIIYVEPMTLERYARVFDTPGPDRFFMCPAPPSAGSCTELPIKHRR